MAELEEAQRAARVIESQPSEDLESELEAAHRRAQNEFGDVEHALESGRNESDRSRTDSDIERSS